MKNYHVEQLSTKGLSKVDSQIRQAVIAAFGQGYDDDVIDDLNSKANPVIQVCKDFNRSVVGFGYGYMAKAGTLSSILKIDTRNLRQSLLSADANGRIGVTKTILTDPAHQGQGIGTSLVRKIEDALFQHHASEIIVPAWKSGDRINIAKTMEKSGYQEEFTVDGYWKEGCDSGDFICTDKTNECVCSAVFYTKSL